MARSDPTEILLKTEKVTLVLEGIGDGKIRCNASSWQTRRSSLRAKYLGCGPMASGCGGFYWCGY